MRSPYSTTFIAATLTVATPLVTYVVPAGRVALISHVSVVQTNAGAAAYFYVDEAQSGTAFRPFYTRKFAINADVNDRGSAVWDGHIAVPGGGTIRAQMLASTLGTITVAGYLLLA